MKHNALLLATLALLAAACGAEPGAGSATDPPSSTTTTIAVGIDEQLGKLAAAQERWRDAAPADYTMTQLDRSSGSADEPETVAVHEGDIVSLSGEATTVDDVFGTIDRSIREGAEVEVEYDPDFGYPLKVVIDRQGDGVPDLHLEHRDLEAMPIVRTVHELQAAERRWNAQGLESYRYIFRVDCTCPEGGTFEVDIRDGRVAGVTPLDQAAAASSLDPAFDMDASFRDLEEWFTDSADLIEEGILAVDVRMDPRYGYPRWFRIEAEDMDSEFFAGRFMMVVTIDLIAELDPIEPEADLDDLREVEAAHALWDDAALDDYRYVLTVHCECPGHVSGPFDVTVRNGEISDVLWASGGGEDEATVFTVPESFDKIGMAVAAGTDVDVTYDPVLGYPQFVVIDPEAVAVDGGLAFSVSDFEPLG